MHQKAACVCTEKACEKTAAHLIIECFHIQHHAKDHGVDCLDIALLYKCNGFAPIN